MFTGVPLVTSNLNIGMVSW